MAENTRMKELATEVKKNAEDIKKFYEEFQIRFDRLSATNEARFQQMEGLQSSNDEKLDRINEALSLLLRNTPQNSSHGAANSNKAPFQIKFEAISSTPTPDGNLNYNDLLDATEKLFGQMYPDEEFFSKTASPEDTIDDDDNGIIIVCI